MTGRLSLAFAVAILLTACQHSAKRGGLWQRNTVVQPAAQSIMPVAYANSYRVGTGDRLRIRVFGEPSLSGEYRVDGAGNIAMPLISTVSVRGRTTPEVQNEISRKLRQGYLRKPSVAIEVLNFRPFFILGEVRRAGQYPYVNGMTVQTAIAIAGGYSERARENRVTVTRQTAEGPKRINLRRNDPVLPGDTIYVKERFF